MSLLGDPPPAVAGAPADNSVTTAKLVDGAVTTAKLADNSVTSAKIVDGTIVDADVNAAAAIALSKLAAGTASKAASFNASGVLAAATPTLAQLNFVDLTSSAQTQINSKITAGAAAIVDADVNAAAGIALTKLAALTNHNRALASNGSGVIAESVTTDAELAFVSGVTSAIQAQLNAITTTIASYLHVRDEEASGTQSGAFNSGSWVQRVLNTVKTNNIAGASLGSNRITLPAGTYRFAVRAGFGDVGTNQARLLNFTDTSVVMYGMSTTSWQDATFVTSQGGTALVNGQFTIASQKVFQIEHQCTNSKGGNGFGISTGFTGNVEVYCEAEFWKVA